MRSKKCFLILLSGFYFTTVNSQTDSLSSERVFNSGNNTSVNAFADNSGNTITSAKGISQNADDEKSDEVYKLNWKVDLPVIALCGGWSAFAFTKIYSKENSTEQEILNLNKNDIPKFDRGAAGNSDEKADMVSDYLFYGSIPYTFTLLLDKHIRRDAGKVALMYLEAMSITGLFYTGSVYLVDRYRPETYNTDLPVSERTSGNNKDSFLAGHPALVATSTFFAASVYNSYHPESNLKYVGYGIAIAATGTTAYLRFQAGKHFPSDLLTGITLGTLSGILVPKFHKNKSYKGQKLGLYPFGNGEINGLTAIYKFD